MIENIPAYYAIIPADVRYNTGLCAGAKLLYGEITALCNKEGFCWATNAYFSKLYGNDTNTVSRWITELTKEGFINCVVDKKSGNARRIYLSPKINIPIFKNQYTPIPENVVTPIPKNVEHNNTVTNNTLNNKINVSPEQLIKNKKLSFLKKLTTYKENNPGKYPAKMYNDFYSYWTEVDELNESNKLRCEKNAFFEVAKRLSTWAKKVKDEELSQMWKDDSSRRNVTELNFEANKID